MQRTATCLWCGTEFAITSRNSYMLKTGRPYCGKACSSAYRSQQSSIRMAETNRKYASARMRERNPMRDPVAKEKMRTKMRALGFTGLRGGNGQATPQQEALAGALGWPMEVAIPTNARATGLDYPTAYKVDVGNTTLRVAIEVDGKGHKLKEKQAEDAKKTAFLESQGWLVLRFWNWEVDASLAQCVQTVLSTISKLPARTPTRPMVSSSTTATTT